MNWMRRRGYVSITSHVIYEVLSPFLIFLLAEELGVSGILAVVAAGLIMQEKTGNIVPPEYARQKMVSNSFWEVILFVINGVLFVMLGMQLPKVLNPESMGGESAGAIILAMLSITLIIMVLRFIWLILIDMIRKDDDTGKRGIKNPRSSVKDAIVTTIAGPKGAVTLSIILTIPMVTEDGQPFPQRDLIIFMTSGVILFTLLLADFLLPKLAPKETNEGEEQELANARIMVIDAVVREASELLEKYKEADFAPALRLSLARYRVRLMRLRFENQCKSGLIEELIDEVLEAQQKKLMRFSQSFMAHLSWTGCLII
jgi:CPA1 family monovalent cation:H+ antiporter